MELVIGVVIDKIASLFHDEVTLLTNVGDEVGLFKPRLKAMEAFLDDARKEAEQHGLITEQEKVRIKQLRDLIFDGESVVEEFGFWFPDRHRKRRRLSSRLTGFTTTLWARRRLGLELRRIRDRADCLNLPEGRPEDQNSRSSVEESRRNYLLITDEARLVGVEEPKRMLSSLIKGTEPRRSAVVVLGMGGSGKTTLADLVYNDAEVENHFKHRAWITVSQSSIERDELLRDVVKQLSRSSDGSLQHPDGGDYDDKGPNSLEKELFKFLRERRYLIVLDDVWRVDLLDEIECAFPDNNCGSRVMLTTRNEEVASYWGGEIYRLKPLSEQNSWTLFCQKAFPPRKFPEGCPKSLEAICHRILERCEGLPLAIAAIGGMLSTKDYTQINQFERVYRDLGTELEGNDKIKRIRKVLSLSFNDLPRNKRCCLLYLAIFPEDGIVKNSLIRLWVAESFTPEENDLTRSTLEELGEDYFSDLFNRSLIQVSKKHDDGRIKACRIHDLIREIILHEANEEYFAMIANQERRAGFPERVRRLSVHKTVENIRAKEVNFSKLRSLLFFQVEDFISSFSISNFLKDTRLLRVLDCSHTKIHIFPQEITNLYNLRYLSLRGTEVSSIPSSIAELVYLQTLNLKDTEIEELPVEIQQLSSLRHIHAYRCVQHGSSEVFAETKGFKALKGIDAVTSLQSLCHMEDTEGGGDILRSIGNLKQLRRLGILGLRREDGADLCKAIDTLNHLVTLDLKSRDDPDEILSLKRLTSAPPCLQRLFLAGKLERLPHWMPQLLGLKNLVLRFSGLRDDPLEHLKELSNLVELRFYKAYEGEEFCFPRRSFPNLRILDLRNLGELRKVRVEEEAIPCVETMIFEECKMLKEMPSGMERLGRLQQLELIDMDAELVKRIRQEEEDNGDYKRIKHIKSVITRSRCGKDGANENIYQYMSSIISSSIGGTNIVQNHDFSQGLDGWKCWIGSKRSI